MTAPTASRTAPWTASGYMAGTLALLLAATLPIILAGHERAPVSLQAGPPGPALAVVAEWNAEEARSVLSVAPLDGGEARAIQESDRQVFLEVEASPSGDRLAYVAEDRATGLHDLMVTSIEGGDPLPIVLGSSESLGSLAWTPDGMTLALAGYEEGGGAAIYTINSVGGPLREMAAPEDYVFVPAFACAIGPLQLFPYEWSPDGSTLLLGVSAPCFEVEFLQVAVVAGDGTGLRTLAAEGWRSGSPDWSPDGQHVVFDSDGQLFSIGVNGDGLELLGSGDQATWSAQGDIASVAASNPTQPSSYDLAVGDPADPQEAEVSSSSGPVGESQWSPDGGSIAYASQIGDQMELAVVDVATRETHPLPRLGVGDVVDFTVTQEVSQ